jgi:UDP-glucose 4-epimerase
MAKKVVVFGGAGFLGSHVADALGERGYAVTVFDCRRSPWLRPGQKMAVGDVLDEAKVRAAVRGAEVVYNFAGVADIAQASRLPLESVRSNIVGNTVILEACRRAEVKRFVFASTLYVYSKAGSFYRSTKQACELLIENYHEIYGLPYTILRYGSLYGPRANDTNYIHQILKQAIKEGRITREGDGEEIREYIHVLDAARDSVDILAPEFADQQVIITGHQAMKIKDLLLMLREILDGKVKIQYVRPQSDSHYEITPYTFAPRIARRLGARSYLDLGQGFLNYVQEVYKELQPRPTSDGLVAAKGRRG